MEGIEKITARIAEDAARERDRILEEARGQADEIAAGYQAQAARECEEILRRGRSSAAEREERLAGVAQLEGRKLELAAKQEMIGRAYDQAMEMLTDLPEQEYTALLAGLAVRAAVTGREEVIFSPKDRARVGKQVVMAANGQLGEGGLTLSTQTRPMKGGLVLRDGDVETNCTFEMLLRLQKSEMDREVARILFD